MSHPSIYEENGAQIASQRVTEPTLRIRIAHAHTLKEGWRLSETTVEWAGVGPLVGEYQEWSDALRGALSEAYLLGEAEAAHRRDAELER